MSDYDKRALKTFLKVYVIGFVLIALCLGIYFGTNALFGPDAAFAVVTGIIALGFVSAIITAASV